MTIRIRYSCPLCGLKDVTLEVPTRRDEEEVTAWMAQTIRLTGQDHARRSPACHPKQLHDLKIPITGADRIGGPVVN